MAAMIIGVMGTESPDAVRATVITSYAMSSILTGVVFFGLGAARLGTLVSFFPHSILVGCIGGVGIFLILTGIEVCVRLDGNFEFTAEVFHKLIEPHSLAQWLPPLALAIILLVVKRYYDRPWLVPAYYIGITAVFYIVTTALPSVDMNDLRNAGWVFEAPDANVSFYHFYSYYQFEKVDWSAVWKTIPSQFALTFFGILHVPINIPNLAMKVQEDNVSINRELILHGVSNTLSGCVGSIQNYLVYVNSVLFIDTGGDSRLAGMLLALATAGLWVAGPVVIGYVPVMVVGTLIYYLGIDLAKEALFDTYGRLHSLEYLTIVIIALVMGIHDFVVGVAVGIGLACLVYVVQTSRKPVVRAQFSGVIAESTVRRPARQRAYLHRVGNQIRVVKLGGYLFFGSIVSVEKMVRAMLDADAFTANPIRFLVLDFAHVTGIDFSAAEAFARINRLLHRRRVEMAFAGVDLQDEVGRQLQMDGLFVEVEGDDLEEEPMPPPKVYEDLNGALEACENILLITLLQEQRSGADRTQSNKNSDDDVIRSTSAPPVPIRITASAIDNIAGSPRTTFRQQAATQTLTETNHHHSPTTPFLLNTTTSQPQLQLPPPSQSTDQEPHQFEQPLQLLLLAFQSHTTQSAEFWSRAAPYFEQRTFSPGERLYSRGDKADGLYVIQKGILRARYALEQGLYHETIVAGTTCGELPFFSETRRTSDVRAAGRGEEDTDIVLDDDLDRLPTIFEASGPAGLAPLELSDELIHSSSSSSSLASAASSYSSSSAAVVAWLLTTERWQVLQVEHPDVARELLKVGLRLSAERMNAVTSYVLITAS
jgi:SulP family sulfate permease